MVYLSQRDPRWVNVKLGRSSLTLGRWGCTTTSISMLTDYFGAFKTPLEIAQSDVYTKDGLIIWKKLKFPRMRFVGRFYGRNDAMIQDAMKDPKKAVILEVADNSHWVVGVKKTLLRDDYVIIDPWDGKKTTACGRYRNVTGFAIFSSL